MNKKQYNHGYEIYKEYSIKNVFNAIDEDSIPDSIIYNKKDYIDSKARVNIIKQLIERDGCMCQNCLEKPTYFGLGKDNGGNWHLDLYSKKDDEHYMYTIDHVFPKSKGGLNHIDNYQLLCKVCNENKSDIIIGENELILKPDVNTKTNSEFNYINKKLKSLNQQTKGILTKVKNHDVVCIKKKRNFTLGKFYSIIEITVKIDTDFNSSYKFRTMDDKGKIILTNFNCFMTHKDSETWLANRYGKY